MTVEPLELVSDVLSVAGPAGVRSPHCEVSSAEADATGVGGAAGWGDADGDTTGEVAEVMTRLLTRQLGRSSTQKKAGL